MKDNVMVRVKTGTKETKGLKMVLVQERNKNVP